MRDRQDKRVRVVGVGMSNLWARGLPIGRHIELAVRTALNEAGLEPRGVAAVIFSNCLGTVLVEGPTADQGGRASVQQWRQQASIRGQAILRDMGLSPAPIFNVEGACGGGVAAIYLGHKLVAAGVDPVLVIGAEQSRVGSPAERKQLIECAVPFEQLAGLRDAFGATPDMSVFMAMNAHWGRTLLDKGLATKEHFAAVAEKAYKHAALEPRAYQRKVRTAAEVLASDIVAEPLHAEMCARFCDGAAAAVLSAAPRNDRDPVLRAVSNVSGDGSLEYHERLLQAMRLAQEAAGIEIGDADVLELHDATSVEEIYSVECLGLFEEGQAADAIRRGLTSLGGGRPVVNPSGGLVGRGHPFGATGVCQLVELTEQLRGTAGSRQVEGARIGIGVNSGGIVGEDAAICGAFVLEATNGSRPS
jgi:acetyl-CoA acetyltransferase